MRKINFDQHIQTNISKFRKYHLLRRKDRLSQPLKACAEERGKHFHSFTAFEDMDSDDRSSLIQANLRRLRSWLADGTLEEIGTRKYRLRL